MTYKYKHFIPQNTAPNGAKKLGVYKGTERICTVPLGRMTPTTKTKLYSFGLVSDIHLYPNAVVEWTPETKFDNALTYFENQGCTFCVQAGDFTQTGLYLEGNSTTMNTAQFAKYKEICDKHDIPVYGIMGNHESYVVPIENNLAEMKTYTGADLYYTIEQGNDLFIFVGQPSGSVVMTDDAFTWLSDTLEANKNRRCFVIIHAYIEEDSGDPMDVRENSIFEYWGTAKKTAFINLLNQYKNVVLFHGHSHMKFQCQELDKSANYTEKNGFKSVHIPSLGVPRDVDTVNKKSVDDRTASQGYIVDVYDDCIVLNGRDFIDNKYIPLGVFKINTTLQTIEAGTFTDSTGTIIT